MGSTNTELPASSVDQATLERALRALVGGDAWPATRLLSSQLTWKATVLPGLAEGRILGLEGAQRYLSRMASAIASGRYRLEVMSIKRTGPDIVAVTVWTGPDGALRPECANAVRFARGEIVSVVEQA